jgi:hypothetical protein
MNDEMRAIPGFDGYAATADGRIRSLDRTRRYKGSSICAVRGRWLKPATDRKGYRVVVLQKHGKGFAVRVHRAVALAWIPNPENKPCINHKDGVKANNAITNLEWCTVSENALHAVRTGLFCPPGVPKRIAGLAQ